MWNNKIFGKKSNWNMDIFGIWRCEFGRLICDFSLKFGLKEENFQKDII